MSEELERVSQALRDERMLRQQADERAARSTEQARIWRRRAEERAERIRELEKAKRPLLSLRRPVEAPPATPIWDLPDRPALDVKSHPSVQIAAALSTAGSEHVLAMFDSRSFSGVPPTSADVVVVSGDVVGRWSPDERDAFRTWTDTPGRAPLLLEHGTRLPFRTPLDVLSEDALLSFPLARPERDPGADLIRIGSSDLGDPGVVARAALGAPLAVDDANPSIAHAATAARRWAYRYHHPRRKAADLLSRAGCEAPDMTPLVSAVLVSNRPELVPDQIRSLLDQTHANVEILIGLHGCRPSDEIKETIEQALDTHRVALGRYPESMTLGECLNQTVSMGSGALVAKIDDDDFYGPAYLEDAVHTFDYTAADIVGKATQFTYIADSDETVVRRPGQEERLMSGTPTGACMAVTRHLWNAVRFPHRPRFVDSVLVRGARALGATVYANSRWEFCYVRQPGGHTWAASSETLLAGAEPAFPGFDTRLVVVDDGCSGLIAPGVA